MQEPNIMAEFQGHAMEPTTVIRNLICYVYPRRGGKWRRTVAHLLAHWKQFDGRKIITISTDRCCDESWEVVQAFGHDRNLEIEWIDVENITGLQEAAHFLPMLERVIDEPGITLYCHAKGATHTDDNAASHKWCDAMAAACLDYPQLVDCAFTNGANVAGAFRSIGLWGFPNYHNWHYAGTWWWFRNERLRQLPWRELHPNFMGVEAYPGLFPLSESQCLFYDNANTAHLYNNDFWRDNITPALGYWRANLAKCGLVPLWEMETVTA